MIEFHLWGFNIEADNNSYVDVEDSNEIEEHDDDDDDDNEKDDDHDVMSGLACPFCSEDFDVLGLCCHIDVDHHKEAKAAVTPLSTI